MLYFRLWLGPNGKGGFPNSEIIKLVKCICPDQPGVFLNTWFQYFCAAQDCFPCLIPTVARNLRLWLRPNGKS